MSTAIKPRYTYDDVRSFLGTRTKQISDVAGQALSPARVIQLSVLCCYQNRRLLECDQGSFLASVIQSCSLGLDLSPSSGEGYLVPYWNRATESFQCRFQIGYQGLVKLACESGKVNYVHSRIVHAHDDFEWAWDPELQLIHRLNRAGKQGPPTHAYSVARLSSGELLGECMTMVEIEKVRESSTRQRADGDPWVDHFEEMAKKTPARRLCKWLPKTPKLIEALETIDADFDWNRQLDETPPVALPFEVRGQTIDIPTAAATTAPAEPVPVTPAPAPPSKTERITARLAARAMAQASTNNGRAEAPNGQPTRQAPAPAPKPAPEPAPTLVPITGRDLDAFCASHLCGTYFSRYGKSRKFPSPISTWSNEQVKRAWDQYEYDVEIGALQPA